MGRLKKYLQLHPIIVKCFILGYVVFAGCFTFPLWSENFPLDFMKVYLIIAGYGIIALGLAGVYGPKKEKKIYLLTLILTVIGLLCRYLLEFGEASNIYNFTAFNIALYILIVPIITMTAYFLIVKYLIIHN